MEFGLSEDHILLQSAVREFARKALAPGAVERATEGRIPQWMIGKIAELGYTSMVAHSRYGGQGMDLMSVGVVVEELGKVDLAAAHVVLIPTQFCSLLESASEEQRQRWLPLLCEGKLIPSLAITESGCGTDAAAISMKAVRRGGRYLLEGEKAPVTRGRQASAFLVWAKTDPQAGARGVSCFFVPSDSAGISVYDIPYAGHSPLNHVTVVFEAVEVAEENRIGGEGEGFLMLMDRFDVIRVLLSLVALAQAYTSLAEVMEYVKIRKAFGRPIAKFEGISFTIAETATRLDAARLLCYRALWMRDQGLKHSRESAMSKLYAPRAAFDAIHDCILMMGHYGYSREYPFTQRLLDVMGYQFADGTAEAQKLVIVREMLGREFLPYK